MLVDVELNIAENEHSPIKVWGAQNKNIMQALDALVAKDYRWCQRMLEGYDRQFRCRFSFIQLNFCAG